MDLLVVATYLLVVDVPATLPCWEHVSKVYKEHLVETILPSIQSVMTAVLHYKKMGGEANLYINDDGLQVHSVHRDPFLLIVWLYSFITFLHYILSLHPFIAFIYCVHSLHSLIASFNCIQHLLIAFIHCIPSFHSFIAFIHCIHSLHSFIAFI